MTVPIDEKAFAKLRRILPAQLAARRADKDWHASPLPEEVAFKLTNRCDLRCSHCYQWGEEGYHRSLPQVDKGGDLPLATIAKVLDATRALRSNVVLWGGEPLIYRSWDGLVDLLAEHARWTVICTNGTMIERRLDGLRRLSRHLEMTISLDGFAVEHDALRGAGAFERSLAGLRALVREQQAGRYGGELTVNCVISDALVPRLFDFVQFLQDEGVGTVFLSLPWYLSDASVAHMDDYVARHFPERSLPETASWHSFSYQLDTAQLEPLRAQLERIAAEPWRIKLRHNPALGADELLPFLRGSDHAAQGKTQCVALRSRLDVFPNSDVVSCKFYPEFVVGNLAAASVAEVWQGTAYDRVRETVATCGLMPACAKCSLLYARGA